MNLHENKRLFKDAVLAASEFLDISPVYIEKDYWITRSLKLLAHNETAGKAVFKGGSSLSKGYRIGNRFSEDIDIAVSDEDIVSGNKLKTLIKKIAKDMTLGMEEVVFPGVTSKGSRYYKALYAYPDILGKAFKGAVGKGQLMVKINSFANPRRYVSKEVDCFIREFLRATGHDDVIGEYGLEPFALNVLDKRQTLIEKLAALIRFSFSDNYIYDLAAKIRHFHDLHFLLRHRFHRAHVVCDLLRCTHTGKDGLHLRQALCEAHRLKSGGIVTDGAQQLFRFCRYIGQPSALYRLHNDHILAVLHGDVVAGLGEDAGGFPVQIIDLQQHAIRLGMGGEDLLQQLRGVVEGKADALGFAGTLKLLQKFKLILLAGEAVMIAALPVEHIGVKIIHTAALSRFFKIAEAVLIAFRHIAGQLGGQFKCLSGIAGGEGLADGDLAFTVQIGVGSIEAPSAGGDKIIHHFIQHFIVDGITFVGQPQESETQLVHNCSSCFFLFDYRGCS